MDVLSITKDALKYPLSEWKKFLILGIIIVLTDVAFTAQSLGIKNIDIIMLLAGIGFLIGFLVNGYIFRIIKSSLNCKNKLPEFKNWMDMGFDGAKVFLVFFVYLIPVIFIIIFLIVLPMEFIPLNFENMGINSFNILIGSFVSMIISDIFTLINWLSFLFLPGEIIISLFGFLCLILIIPLFFVAIANMAYYEGEFKSAFRISEIFEEISLIGWFNLIKWYLATGMIFLVIELMLLAISYISFIINLNTVIDTLLWKILALTLIPYRYIFLARSVALFYMPDEEEIDTEIDNKEEIQSKA